MRFEAVAEYWSVGAWRRYVSGVVVLVASCVGAVVIVLFETIIPLHQFSHGGFRRTRLDGRAVAADVSRGSFACASISVPSADSCSGCSSRFSVAACQFSSRFFRRSCNMALVFPPCSRILDLDFVFRGVAKFFRHFLTADHMWTSSSHFLVLRDKQCVCCMQCPCCRYAAGDTLGICLLCPTIQALRASSRGLRQFVLQYLSRV